MRKALGKGLVLMSALALTVGAIAADDPATARSDLMTEVREAAKPIGGMLRGRADFDQAAMNASLQTFAEAAATMGDLFPDGSQGGKAADAIWTDRAGFDEEIAAWSAAIEAAKAANPGSLDDAKPLLGAVMGSCRSCHDAYRIEDD